MKTGVEKTRKKRKPEAKKEKMAHPRSGVPLQLRRRPLGRQRVVVAFAALALAAQHDGRGQQEEGGGDQQEEAKAGENPHHLGTDSGGDAKFQSFNAGKNSTEGTNLAASPTQKNKSLVASIFPPAAVRGTTTGGSQSPAM